jgi:hypothetical protein
MHGACSFHSGKRDDRVPVALARCQEHWLPVCPHPVNCIRFNSYVAHFLFPFSVKTFYAIMGPRITVSNGVPLRSAHNSSDT